MENFIVSARKYRPQTFASVVGQKAITGTLKNAILNNHLAQAFLFCGPRGVGKTTCARIFAKTINCENISPDGEACNQCESCVSFNESASFNIHELDAASNNSVDDIRNLVDQVRIPPQVGKYKVYIIDEVHMLSSAAFNAFLKTLEEPPGYAKFILATTEKHKIIPTILSRCQIYDFKRITVEDIARHLEWVAGQEGVKAEPDALHVIAQKADGALRDALSIFDQIVSFSGKEITYRKVIENLNVLDFEYFFKITDAILSGDIRQTLLIINEIIDNGFDGQHFVIGFGEHIRNLLVAQDKATVELLEASDSIKKRYIEQTLKCTPGFLIKSLDLLNKCDLNYKISNNKKMLVELTLLQMCSLTGEPQEKKKPVTLPDNKQTESKTEPVSRPAVTPKPESVTTPAVKQTATHRQNKAFSTGVIPGTVSISKPQPTTEKPEKEQEDLSEKPANDFSLEQFLTVWEKYLKTIESDKYFYSTLNQHKPQLSGETITVTVDNKVQAKSIEEKKTVILEFIRRELNNFRVMLDVTVTDKPDEVKLYAADDKYKAMVKKNPALKKLKEQLSLDIDL